MRALLVACLAVFVVAALAAAWGQGLRAYARGIGPEGAGVPRAGTAFRVALRETALGFWLGVTWPLGLLGRGVAAAPWGARPVLVVAGFGMTAAAVRPLAGWLARRGADPAIPFAPAPRSGSLAVRAPAIAEAVREIARRTPGGRVDVVAFGAGGVALGAALADDPALPVGRSVLLGVPLAGARSSVFLPALPAAELAPGSSPTSRARAAFEAAAGHSDTAVTAVVADEDGYVLPSEAAPPPSAAQVRVPGQGHLGLLASVPSFDAVAAALGLPPRSDSPVSATAALEGATPPAPREEAEGGA